jgi:S-adenosylmethionine hydrolase
MPRPLITLTTDFGAADHFVAAMKGVILGLRPAAEIIDVTHAIEPYNVHEGGFVLAQAYSCFPKKTIHIAIVDPGVGSARRPLLVEAGGHFFLGPDNGVFSMVYAREPKHRVRHITQERFFRKDVSRTFHGRDIFAPCAAHLARPTPPARFGKPIQDYTRLALAEPQRTARRVWTGAVLKVDHFGNLITNLHIDQFPDLPTRPFELRVGLERLRRLALTYAETSIGEVFVIVGSSGYFEVAANQGSAARILGCGAGAPVELEVF